ncbi:MAG: SanA/YdcF family protein [Nevskiales bacterium]
MDTEADQSAVSGTRRRLKKRFLLGLPLALVGLVAAACVLANHWVVTSARPYIYSAIDDLPLNHVGLVLGTSSYTRSGSNNLLFDYRMSAAADLYRSGKVQHLLLSGANPTQSYNEPRMMYQALIDKGVPHDAMTLDFAGFRTLDSVVRAGEVFRLGSFTILSQRFHDYRAVFIARQKGLDAIAYAVPEQTEKQIPRTWWREFFARVRAVLDVSLLGTQPRFLGEPVEIAPAPDAQGTYDLIEEEE